MTSKDNYAIVDVRDLPISTKHAIEICNCIRGKNLLKSKKFLEDAKSMKKAVPFKRFKGDVGHKKGKIGPGRYPVKACEAILKLVESLEINAQNKGLDTASLFLKEIVPNRGSNVMRYGRQRRRTRKLTHIFMLAEESIKEKKKKESEEKKAEKPKEEKKAEKPKEEKKPEEKKAEKSKDDKPEVKK